MSFQPSICPLSLLRFYLYPSQAFLSHYWLSFRLALGFKRNTCCICFVEQIANILHKQSISFLQTADGVTQVFINFLPVCGQQQLVHTGPRKNFKRNFTLLRILFPNFLHVYMVSILYYYYLYFQPLATSTASCPKRSFTP